MASNRAREQPVRRETRSDEGEDDEVRIGQAGTLEAETFGYLAAGQPAGEQPSDVCREQLVVCCLKGEHCVVAQSLLASVGWANTAPRAFRVSHRFPGVQL